MKHRMLIAAVMIFMSSCIYTFYPLSSPDRLVDMPGLEGSFVKDDSEEDKPEVWTFTRDTLGKYVLTIEAGQEKGALDVQMVRLGGVYFMQLIPSDYNGELIPDFIEWTLIPMYIIAKVKPQGNNFELLFFDPQWLEDKLASHKIRMAYETRTKEDSGTSDFLLLTAKTEELQKFVEKYARLEEAFDPDNHMRFMRSTAN